MQTRPLGTSGLDVSRLSLGSWRTFERISRDEGLAVMYAAREHGINFLDDARYDDETGRAPIATGHSEVLFGELFRGAGWDRARTIVSNKLWWEFWPQQSAAAELDASLGRMGFDYVDVIYANPAPAGLEIEELVASIGELIASGRARTWAIVNWEAEPLAEAARAADEQGVPQPCGAQLPYNVLRRDWVQSEAMAAALRATGASVVASHVLAGGVLTGKYDAGHTGRAAATIEGQELAGARARGRAVRALADELGVSPAALAIAFVLADPVVATALLGATRPEQIAENASALELDPAAAQRVAAL